MTSPPRLEDLPHPGSFRDPSGFLFQRGGVLYRQVSLSYREHYDALMGSGLYAALTAAGRLVRHEEAAVPPAEPGAAYRVLRPEPVPFISYPYEWCFGELRDAALATLAIQRTALEHGMILKDASAYNIQFFKGRPTLIDTLSFEKLAMRPWVAYRQFCQHFLAPLLLMARRDHRLGQLSRVFIDGVPLDLAAKLLPGSTRLRPGIALHIHLHAASQKRYETRDVRVRERPVSLVSLKGLADSLERLVRKLRFRAAGTEWGGYYEDTNYSDEAFADKKRVVGEFLDLVRPATVWDLGANTGVFARLAAARGASTIAFDIDPAAVETGYRDMVRDGETNLLPLVLDLANPSPALGWAHRERGSWLERGPADAVLALALVHHLAISNNLPFALIAETFRRAGRRLIIEFVPKGDSQVQRLLRTREDVFPGYTREAFEAEFARQFVVERRVPVRGSERTLYLMTARTDGA